MRCVPALDDAWMMSANWNYSTMDESMTDQKFTDIETAGKTPGVSGLKPSSNTTLPVGAIAAGGLRQTDQWVAGSSKAMSPFVDTACPDFSDEAAKMISDSDQATDLPTSKCLPRLFAAMHEHVTAHNGQLHLIFVEIANLRQVCNMAEADVEERLLRAVADRIKSCLGPDDLVGHHYCDEFVILAPEERDQKGLHCLLDALRRIVRSPVAVEGIPYHLFLRIGVSTYPNDGETFGILLKRAGAASRYAAPFEPDVLNFYTEKFSADVRERMLLRADLHEAIGLEQMILHYQPQIDVMSGQTVGVEALVRWAHPTRGMIMPGQFIPVAEETGLIIAMGKWILYEACRQAVMWQRAYAPGLTMAVNLSVAQLRHAGVVEIVRGALRQSGLPAGLLKLELTESVFLEDAERVLRILEEFRSMGVKLSIDDFGVGYSSLAYLKRLSVDQLKIDQSFIRDLTVDATNSEIVKAIIGLGHSLRLSVVAEGVETPQQMNLLRRLGCHHVQGFLFSRPIPATALRSWID